MIRGILVAIGILIASAASAQTGRSIAWDYPVAPSVAQGWAHTVTLDGTVLAGTVTCVAAPSGSTCSMPVPTPVDLAAPHTVVVTAIGGGVQHTSTVTTDPARAPRPAGGLRIVVSVTVEVP